MNAYFQLGNDWYLISPALAAPLESRVVKCGDDSNVLLTVDANKVITNKRGEEVGQLVRRGGGWALEYSFGGPAIFVLEFGGDDYTSTLQAMINACKMVIQECY